MRRYTPILLLLAGLVMPEGKSASASTPVTAQDSAHLALWAAMPKGPTWTRPAPTTWSSRANVRWEARWGGDARYMT